MDKLMEAFVEDLFKSPAFRVQLQLWFTEAVSGLDIVSPDEYERICVETIEHATIKTTILV
jgi:hypothetical protein